MNSNNNNNNNNKGRTNFGKYDKIHTWNYTFEIYFSIYSLFWKKKITFYVIIVCIDQLCMVNLHLPLNMLQNILTLVDVIGPMLTSCFLIFKRMLFVLSQIDDIELTLKIKSTKEWNHNLLNVFTQRRLQRRPNSENYAFSFRHSVIWKMWWYRTQRMHKC